jgi:hypothetical protein
MNTNKVFYVKFIHTIIFFFMLACLVYILYCGIAAVYHWTVCIAIGAIIIEGVVLLLNKGRCPFTGLAEKYGAEKGSVTDIFLPDCIARTTFTWSTIMFAVGLILLGIRYFFKI